jgi:hypothetical protein
MGALTTHDLEHPVIQCNAQEVARLFKVQGIGLAVRDSAEADTGVALHNPLPG